MKTSPDKTDDEVPDRGDSERRAGDCPLCGRENGCARPRSAAGDVCSSPELDCWCSELRVHGPSLDALPPGSDASCLCIDCVRGDYPSPCRKVCDLDPARGRCSTCLRTTDEIFDWAKRSPEEKLEILSAVAHRRAELRA